MKRIYHKWGTTPLPEIIAKLKSNDPTFTELNLQEVKFNVSLVDSFEVSHFNDEILLELAAAIKENKTLKRFKFNGLARFGSGTDWTHISAEAIGSALKDHPALEEIHLPFNQKESVPLDQTSMTSLEMSGILQALSGKAKIKNLYLTAVFSDDVLSSLGKSLADNTTLESITILSSDVNIYDEYKEDALQTFAAGFAGKSLQHLNLKLRLNDASIEILSQHLSKINTLKTMILNGCNITPIGMTSITNPLKKNPYVTDLDLSDNPLGSSGGKSLAGALPNLLQLRTLLLNKTDLDDEALDALAHAWRKSNLKIRTLEINLPYAYNDAYLAAVKKIIGNNKYLKKITMVDHRFKKEHFYLLKNLLQDPSQCRLQQFFFGGNLVGCDDYFNNILIDILKRNPHLTVLNPHYSSFHLTAEREVIEVNQRSVALTTAWRTNVANQKISQQLFVEKVILFSAMYFSPSEHTTELNIFSLPPDAFLLILYHLGLQEAFGKYDEDVFKCARLIFENFSTRRKLITEEKYSPIEEINPTSKAEVSKWWSLSPRGDNSKPIFRERAVKNSKAEVNQVNSKSRTLERNEAVDSKPVKPSTKCTMM